MSGGGGVCAGPPCDSDCDWMGLNPGGGGTAVGFATSL